MSTHEQPPDVRIIDVEARTPETAIDARIVEIDHKPDELDQRLADLEQVLVYVVNRSHLPSDRYAQQAFVRMRERVLARQHSGPTQPNVLAAMVPPKTRKQELTELVMEAAKDARAARHRADQLARAAAVDDLTIALQRAEEAEARAIAVAEAARRELHDLQET